MNARINASFLRLMQQDMSTLVPAQNHPNNLGPIKMRVIPYRTPVSSDVKSTEMVDFHEID